MKSKIIYKDNECDLTDDFIDIGYSAENFMALNIEDKEIEVKKSNKDRKLQIFLSFPSFDEFKDEIISIDEFLNTAKVEIVTYIIFSNKIEISYKFKKLIPIFDTLDEFGDMYGTKIVSGYLKDRLTKALFLIGKDGAIYHIDMPNDLQKPLDIEKIRVELNKAYQSYTGVGCHG